MWVIFNDYVLVVDANFPWGAREIVPQIRATTNKPIRFVLNTHDHGDIGATIRDKKFRASDKSTGKLLWETSFPFSACATPATYEMDGRQYVVIGAGGQRDPATPAGGGVYVAYALPQ